jgi:O-antigen/teichoic acid export membrane protein
MGLSRTANSKRNLITGWINKIILLFLPFLTRTFITYYIGSEYLGLNNLFTSVLQMLNLAELGLSSAIVFCMYKPIANNDNDTLCALLNFYRKIYHFIGLFILGLGICLIPFLDLFIKGNTPSGINITIIYLFFLINTSLGYLMYSYRSSLFIAHQRSDVVNKINTFVICIQNIIQIVLLIIFRDYYIYIFMMPIFTLVNNLIVAYLSKKQYPNIICRGKLSSEILTDLKYKISGLMVSKLCATSRNSLDNIIISSFIGLNAVAIYGNYYLIMSGIQSILSIATVSISASVGNSIVLESPKKNYQDMMKFGFMYSWIAGVCTCCLLNLYQPFMQMWMGQDLMFNYGTVILICIYFYSLTLGDVRSVYVTGAGLWWESRFRSILEALMNIILNIVLGYFFGINGVIVATIISIILINFGYGSTIIFKYYFKKSYRKYYAINIYYAAVICMSCIATYLLCSLFIFDGIIGLLIRLIISILVSNMIYLIFYNRLSYFKQSVNFIKSNFLHIG